eukprot:jgi/Bigna1/53502/estExt_Genewise1Plus.C_200084
MALEAIDRSSLRATKAVAEKTAAAAAAAAIAARTPSLEAEAKKKSQENQRNGEDRELREEKGEGEEETGGESRGKRERNTTTTAGDLASSPRSLFQLYAPYNETSEQHRVVSSLSRRILEQGSRHSVLKGATGTGKTFVMGRLIQEVNRPTLVLAPNKVLAAQLYDEFKRFFPNNAVEYFVSYYDFYRPESYKVVGDIFLDKMSNVNDDIDRLRHSATRALLERRDVVVVASVSCIYGLGMPKSYVQMAFPLEIGQIWAGGDGDEAMNSPGEEEIRIAMMGKGTNDEGRIIGGEEEDIFPDDGDGPQPAHYFEAAAPPPLPSLLAALHVMVYPASHHVLSSRDKDRVVEDIKEELDARLQELIAAGQTLEARRLRDRTRRNIEEIEAKGFCKGGIENYSRHLSGKSPGEPPDTLLDYFPHDEWLLVIDESHVTVPQIGGMFEGDRRRKTTLVQHGFRLPSAVDNRPLTGAEFWARVPQALYVSATPGAEEIRRAAANHEELVLRPTGILDPKIEIRKLHEHVDDLLEEVMAARKRQERVLITVVTKRLAEGLATFLQERERQIEERHDRCSRGGQFTS